MTIGRRTLPISAETLEMVYADPPANSASATLADSLLDMPLGMTMKTYVMYVDPAGVGLISGHDLGRQKTQTELHAPRQLGCPTSQNPRCRQAEP